MKKTLTAIAIMALCTTAAPAFADHHMGHGHSMNDGHDHSQVVTSTSTTRTYRVVTPLTPEEVALRRDMQTQIEREVKRADLDGDRLISFEEYAYGERVLQKDNLDVEYSFNQTDADGNGKLNSQEIMDYRWGMLTKNVTPVVKTTTMTTRTVQ